jgi:membrane fusion protein, multidrug efflux system
MRPSRNDVIAALIVVASVALSACDVEPARPPATPLPTRSVRVEHARLDVGASGEEVVGTVRARNSAAISSTVVGKVQALNVTLGRRVQTGDVLARISADEIGAKLDQTEALYAQAKVDLDRAQSLLGKEAIPRAQYDAAASAFRVAQARRAEAAAMAGHTVLRAPFGGVVSAKLANVGDTAMPGQALLVLDDPSALRLEATVPEVAARTLKIGEAVPVRVGGRAGDLTGTVAEISPAADPLSRTVLAKIDLPGDPALHPGLLGRLILASPTEQPRAVLVPSVTVVRRGQLEEVFVVDRGRARLRLVKTGRVTSAGATEILSGLAAGDAVVASDVAEIVDGQPVEARL